MAVSTLKDLLPKDYGYVVLVAAGGSMLNWYLMAKVGKARKQFNVKYPDLYSTDSVTFNCIQRSHQNYLENYPFFVTNLLLGGLQNPKSSAVAGLIFLIARVMYSRGYSTGDPKNRTTGAIPAAFMSMFLMGNTICFGVVHSGVLSSMRCFVKRP